MLETASLLEMRFPSQPQRGHPAAAMRAEGGHSVRGLPSCRAPGAESFSSALMGPDQQGTCPECVCPKGGQVFMCSFSKVDAPYF